MQRAGKKRTRRHCEIHESHINEHDMDIARAFLRKKNLVQCHLSKSKPMWDHYLNGYMRNLTRELIKNVEDSKCKKFIAAQCANSKDVKILTAAGERIPVDTLTNGNEQRIILPKSMYKFVPRELYEKVEQKPLPKINSSFVIPQFYAPVFDDCMGAFACQELFCDFQLFIEGFSAKTLSRELQECIENFSVSKNSTIVPKIWHNTYTGAKGQKVYVDEMLVTVMLLYVDVLGLGRNVETQIEQTWLELLFSNIVRFVLPGAFRLLSHEASPYALFFDINIRIKNASNWVETLIERVMSYKYIKSIPRLMSILKDKPLFVSHCNMTMESIENNCSLSCMSHDNCLMVTIGQNNCHRVSHYFQDQSIYTRLAISGEAIWNQVISDDKWKWIPKVQMLSGNNLMVSFSPAQIFFVQVENLEGTWSNDPIVWTPQSIPEIRFSEQNTPDDTINDLPPTPGKNIDCENNLNQISASEDEDEDNNKNAKKRKVSEDEDEDITIMGVNVVVKRDHKARVKLEAPSDLDDLEQASFLRKLAAFKDIVGTDVFEKIQNTLTRETPSIPSGEIVRRKSKENSKTCSHPWEEVYTLQYENIEGEGDLQYVIHTDRHSQFLTLSYLRKAIDVLHKRSPKTVWHIINAKADQYADKKGKKVISCVGPMPERMYLLALVFTCHLWKYVSSNEYSCFEQTFTDVITYLKFETNLNPPKNSVAVTCELDNKDDNNYSVIEAYPKYKVYEQVLRNLHRCSLDTCTTPYRDNVFLWVCGYAHSLCLPCFFSSDTKCKCTNNRRAIEKSLVNIETVCNDGDKLSTVFEYVDQKETKKKNK